MIYHVYVHYTEIDSRVFYVGKTKNISRITTLKRNHQPAWYNITNDQDWGAALVDVFHTDEEACELEIELIKYFREAGHPLVNVCSGGNGAKGYKFDADGCALNKERGRKGGEVSSEAKRLAAIANAKKPRGPWKKYRTEPMPSTEALG